MVADMLVGGTIKIKVGGRQLFNDRYPWTQVTSLLPQCHHLPLPDYALTFPESRDFIFSNKAFRK